MGVKRLVKAFVAFTVFAVAASTTYHYYVGDKTPSSAMFQALDEYTSVMNSLVTKALDLADQYRS
ncbi:MAG: hypothetical protein ACQEQY_04325 [Halobacteriota archaeon]